MRVCGSFHTFAYGFGGLGMGICAGSFPDHPLEAWEWSHCTLRCSFGIFNFIFFSHVCTHAYTHKYTHTHVHTYTYAFTRTHVHTNTPDTVFVICYSLIILSVDLTSPHVKNKMSKREFIRNLRRATAGVSDELLGHMYDNIYLSGHVATDYKWSFQLANWLKISCSLLLCWKVKASAILILPLRFSVCLSFRISVLATQHFSNFPQPSISDLCCSVQLCDCAFGCLGTWSLQYTFPEHAAIH